MAILNTEEKYGKVAVIIHAIMAVMIIGILAVGFIMTNSSFNPNFYFLHKSFGLLILMLAFFRLGWKIFNKKPKINAKGAVLKLAKAGHFVLYIFMFLMPVSGLMMSLFKGYSVSFFNIFTIKAFTKNQALGSFFAELHEISGILLAIILLGHIFMALFHHFILKDNTLRKMF
jgi:cytochrome b561